MGIVEKAAQIAARAHKEQVRKTENTPYIVHPFMVAMKLLEHNFSETIVAAALVHDVLEDTSITKEVLQEKLGDEVVRIVLSVTEDTSLPWEERKKAYIESVRRGGEDAKAVSISDKIHNLQSMLDGFEKQGPSLWEKFNRGKEQQLWFMRELLNMYKENWEHSFVNEYEKLVVQMEKLS